MVTYQRLCNSRFEHINSMVIKSKKPTLVIATHPDKCGLSENEMARRFNTIVESKSYKGMFQNMDYVNLTNKSEITLLRDKLFNTKENE